MADNIKVAPDIVGEVVPQSVVDVATDDVGGVHYQVVKLGLGAANAVNGHLATGQALMADSLPVVIASNQTAFGVTGTFTGTVTANLGTIADVATQTTLNSLNGKVTTCNTGAVDGTVSIRGYNGTNYVVPRVDAFTTSWQTIDYAHHEIHSGSSFYYHDVITLGSAGVQDYLITVPNTAKWPHMTYLLEGFFGVTLELYEATDKTGTTPQTIYNRDRNSATAATTTIDKGTSGGTTDGTRIAWRVSGSGTSTGRLAASTAERNERILKQGTKYIFRLTSAAASNTISIEIDWYEHTNATP